MSKVSSPPARMMQEDKMTAGARTGSPTARDINPYLIKCDISVLLSAPYPARYCTPNGHRITNLRLRPRGGVVTQRIANPRTPVQFRTWPPNRSVKGLALAMILGVILAGGRGTRLGGVIKANIEIAGITLLDRMAGALRAQCDMLILSTGKIAPHRFTAKTHPLTVADALDIEAGPVGGLSAAVAWARAQSHSPEFLLTAAVDTPFFPQDFVDMARPLMLPGVDCVMGAEAAPDGVQTFPTNCLWRTAAIANLPELIETPRAPHGLRNVIAVEHTAFLQYPALSLAGCFANVNTPADVQLCTELAKSLPPANGITR